VTDDVNAALVRAIVNHLTAIADGKEGDPSATQWRQWAPNLTHIEAALPRLPHQHAWQTKAFIKALAAGESMDEAATEAGVSVATVKRWRQHYPSFDREVAATYRSRARSSQRKVVDEDRLKTMWADPNLGLRGICSALGVSKERLKDEATRLGLPDRPDGRPSQVSPLAAVEAEFRELWADRAVKVSDIAKRFEVHPQTAGRFGRRLELPSKQGTGASTRSPERDMQLRALWSSDITVKEIAARMGVSGSAVSQRAKRLGLPPRGVRRPTADQ
jgi:transposase